MCLLLQTHFRRVVACCDDGSFVSKSEEKIWQFAFELRKAFLRLSVRLTDLVNTMKRTRNIEVYIPVQNVRSHERLFQRMITVLILYLALPRYQDDATGRPELASLESHSALGTRKDTSYSRGVIFSGEMQQQATWRRLKLCHFSQRYFPSSSPIPSQSRNPRF